MSNLTSNSTISLRKLTSDNFIDVMNLNVAPEDRQFLATNDRSMAEAHFSDQAWYRAIYADDTPVGFVLLADEECGTRKDPDPNCALWRFMIDERYQRLGFGGAALRLVVEHVRTHERATMLLTSYLPGNISAENFYLKFGFKLYSGETPRGEIGLVLDL